MKTCNEFLQEMRDAGFDFTFRATNGDTVIHGECKPDENNKLVIKAKRELTASDQVAKIAQLKAKLGVTA